MLSITVHHQFAGYNYTFTRTTKICSRNQNWSVGENDGGMGNLNCILAMALQSSGNDVILSIIE